jgi:hypothetical protein
VDVEASRRFDLRPQRLEGDTVYGEVVVIFAGRDLSVGLRPAMWIDAQIVTPLPAFPLAAALKFGDHSALGLRHGVDSNLPYL